MESQNGDMPHIGIVGAGASGLRCADILLSHGFKVTILEARDRIGGRICRSDELGYAVDMNRGPNWVHTWDSGDVHPILKLAAETKMPLHHWNDSNGNIVPDEKTERLSTLLWEIIKKAFKASEAAREKDKGGEHPTGRIPI
ncbi:uncharacterized protein F4812DRAFT_23412 [Daldinia caldariorum]|uniref:uncharacterized protein n=1 Tax=Daldinia caldariorum TaxID=326644 RepID=UPI0020080983|nr:uncharacterized protein F4812DRAFT_23412 [Daldinia caldariorum]KAI1472742.1 hypothetical protein F4812DRAFT_23412 [Daldinia caldariorum]